MSSPGDLFDIMAESPTDIYVIMMVIVLVLVGLVALYYTSMRVKGDGYKMIVYFLLTGVMCSLIAVVHEYGFVANEKNTWYLACFGFALVYFLLFGWNTYTYFTNHPEYIKAKAAAEARSLPPSRNV